MRVEPDWEHWLRWQLNRRWRNSRKHNAQHDFRLALRALPEGSLAIDCGANVGDITGMMHRRGLRVIAFEPDPLAAARLRLRFAGAREVEIIEKAVGGAARQAEFFQRRDAGTDIRATQGSSLLRKRQHGEAGVCVEVIDLPAFIAALGEPVGLLKVDIEGTEPELLEGLLDTGIHARIGRIYVETHERFSPDIARRLEAIRARLRMEGIANINMDWV